MFLLSVTLQEVFHVLKETQEDLAVNKTASPLSQSSHSNCYAGGMRSERHDPHLQEAYNFGGDKDNTPDQKKIQD